MKILKGFLKGRNIASPSKIRPVSVRVKKSCFDILAEMVKESNILDLFAGSGALGIEALSMGAASASFVDINKRCIDKVKRTLSSLKLMPKSRVYLRDAFSQLKFFLK